MARELLLWMRKDSKRKEEAKLLIDIFFSRSRTLLLLTEATLIRVDGRDSKASMRHCDWIIMTALVDLHVRHRVSFIDHFQSSFIICLADIDNNNFPRSFWKEESATCSCASIFFSLFPHSQSESNVSDKNFIHPRDVKGYLLKATPLDFLFSNIYCVMVIMIIDISNGMLANVVGGQWCGWWNFFITYLQTSLISRRMSTKGS